MLCDGAISVVGLHVVRLRMFLVKDNFRFYLLVVRVVFPCYCSSGVL